MKLRDIKSNILKILNEYSFQGIDKGIMDNYDYLKRANVFINDAQQEIAEIKRIKDVYTVSQVGVDEVGYNYYPLPSDLNELRYVKFGDSITYSYKIENEEILFPKNYDGDFEVYYYKYPTEITSSTSDDYNLEIQNNLQNLTAYYAAAMLSMPIDTKLSDRLMDLYHVKLKNIVPDADENYSRIVDVTGW